jgi:TonB family protein
MTKRNAIAISVAFHAVLLTALVFYWIFQKPPEPTVEKGEVIIATVKPLPKKPEAPEKEKPPKPPIREARDPRPTMEPTPFTPNPEPTKFEGPIDQKALQDPPSPLPVVRGAPSYPEDCLRDGHSGEVQATLTIAPDGEVIDVEIVSSTRNCFAREAKKALKRWRYPAQLVTEVSTGGNRQVTVEIEFDLEDAK